MGYSTTSYLAYGVAVPEVEDDELRDAILEKVNSRPQVGNYPPATWKDYSQIYWPEVADHWNASRPGYAELVAATRLPGEAMFELEHRLADDGLIIRCEDVGDSDWGSCGSVIRTLCYSAYSNDVLTIPVEQLARPCGRHHADAIRAFFDWYGLPFPAEGPQFKLFSYRS